MTVFGIFPAGGLAPFSNDIATVVGGACALGNAFTAVSGLIGVEDTAQREARQLVAAGTWFGCLLAQGKFAYEGGN